MAFTYKGDAHIVGQQGDWLVAFMRHDQQLYN